MEVDEADRLDALLSEVEAQDARTREAIVATNASPPEDPDDYYIDLVGRLELPLVPPTYRSSNGRTTCRTCGAHAGSPEVHSRWHLRVQAVTKVSAHMAELAWKHSALLGLTLSTVLSEPTRAAGVEELEVLIDGLRFVKPPGTYTGAEIRRFAHPPISEDRDLYAVASSRDLLVLDDGEVVISVGASGYTEFRTDPKDINNG